MHAPRQLPGGTVSFVFTDIEGSTRLQHELGVTYGAVIRDHRRLVREQLAGAGGCEVDTQGDAFFYAFARASDAVRGAVAAQRALSAHPWPAGSAVRVRIGLHTGEPTLGDEGYLGIDVVRAARICAAGHGGQIVASAATRHLVGERMPEGVHARDLGEVSLKDLPAREHLYELVVDDAGAFPPLAAERPLTAKERLQERIEQHVQRQLDQAFLGDDER